MNITRVTVFCLFLLCWVSICPIQAQEYYPVAEAPPSYGPSTGYAAIEPSDHYVPYDPLGIRFRTRADIGDGVGYEGGYQSFSAFLPAMMEQGRSLIFLDARGIASYKGDLAANIGAGLRVYSPEVDRVFGAAFWYDSDENDSERYDQFGISLESLGKYFDVRANAYLPTDDTQKELSSTFTGGVYFNGNNILFNRTALVQTTLSGGDFEVGGALPGIGDYGIRSYVGGYYYQGRDSDNTYGVKFRTEALVTEDLSMQVGVTNDDFFGTNVTMAVSLLLPDGKPSRILSRQPTQERLYAAMDRNYRIAVRRRVIDAPTPALRAGGQGGSGGAVGTPIVVTHVDSSAGAGGDGTFENPFNFLPTSTPGSVDIVFVNRGTGTAFNYDDGIRLNDNQRLLGEGFLHRFTSTRGIFVLPGFTIGDAPVITNTTLASNLGNAVILGNNNEVSYFQIGGDVGSGFDPIANNGISGGSVNNFNLNNLDILLASRSGISIANATGAGIIRNVDVSIAGQNGIGLSNIAGGTLNLTMDNVNVTGAVQNGISLQATALSTINAPLGDVTSQGNGTGLSLSANAASTINVSDAASTSDLIFSNNGNNGVFVSSNNASTVNLDLTRNFAGSTGDVIDSNVNNGILGTVNGASAFNLALNGTTITTHPLGSGIDITATANSRVSVDITGATIEGAGLDGVGITLDGSRLTSFSFDSSSASNNGGTGIDILGTAGSDVGNVSFLNSQIDTNALAGVSIDLTGGSIDDVVFDNSSATGNVAGNGFGIVMNGVAGGSLTVTDSDLSSNGLDGLFVSLLNGSTFDAVNISDNNTTFSNNGDDGIHVNLSGNLARITNLTIDNNVLDANAANGINITGTNAQITNLLVNDNLVTGSLAGAGLNVNLNNVTTSVDVTGNTFTGNANTGFTFFGNSSAFDLTVGGSLVNANTIDQNAGAGIVVDLTGTTAGTLDIQNNTVTQSTDIATDAFLNGEGISVRTRQSAILNGSTIANNVIGDLVDPTLGNEGTGIFFQAEATSQLIDTTVALNDVGNNGGSGIRVLRTANAVIDNFDISENNVVANLGNGVDLEVRNGNGDILDFTVSMNNISDNIGNGIQLFAREDALLNADITQNVIDNNLTGILVIESSNDITDTREVSGTWTKNTITNNTQHGIQLAGSHGVTNPLIIGLNGFDPADGLSLGNVISDNALDGISIDAPGIASITNNTITGNGTGGIDVNSQVFFGNTLEITNNNISENLGDGVELNAISLSSLVLDVTLLGNTINDNSGRGIDLLNQLNATTILNIGDDTLANANFIQGNDLEGVYVVNTAASAQNQTNSSSLPLVTTTNLIEINTTPNIVFNMQRNFVDGNGNASTLSGTGVVLRVGTTNVGDPSEGDTSALFGNGQVNARMTNNRIAGSNGTDVVIESFVSAIPRTTTATVFDNDPLARLNLVFTGNTGDALNVTRFGAFFANADAIKSPVPPFLATNRRRNAQRVPSIFPGLGNSTFQVEGDFDVSGFTAGDTFLLDTFPVPPSANANGVPFPGATIGELPFGWRSVAPGTFTFP